MDDRTRPQRSLAVTSFSCCDCGATYSSSRYLNAHEREHCIKSKRGFSRLLGQAKEAWEARKRRRIEKHQANLPAVEEEMTVPKPPVPAQVIELGTDTQPTLNDHLAADEPIARRRGTRHRQLPAQYRENSRENNDTDDDVPEPLAPLNNPDMQAQIPEVEDPLEQNQNGSEPADGVLQPDRARPKRWWTSHRNKFALWRRYYAASPPSRDPELSMTTEDLDDSMQPTVTSAPQVADQYGPFDNTSSLLLADFWWNSENEKSRNEFTKLLKILKDPSFSLEDVISADWGKLEAALNDGNDDEGWFDDAAWISTPISISVPFHKRMNDPGTKHQVVGNLHHRKIVAVIEEKIRHCKDPSLFHYQPYEVYWVQDSESPVLRVQGELYNSPAFVEAHQRLQDQPPIPGCNRERIVVALMFWSDETQLTAFGSAQLWPCYMFFGNESKYRRGKTSLRLCEHIAYFESLPDDFKDYLMGRNGGKLPPKEFLTYCKREIFHAQWRILLDGELLDAMENGIVIMCHDGIERRFFPVPFTYSADYPERTRIAAIKQNGGFPCTRCLVPKDQVQNMGTAEDITIRTEQRRVDDHDNVAMIEKALKEIEKGRSVIGKAVDKHLTSRSLLPIKTAFSENLRPFGFDIYDSLVVDPLHEIEIGVWKTLYEHLLRLLDAFGKQNLLAELDQRYREVPLFGRDTIRKFSTNASSMTRKAARDYEDLLQCSMPVFDSLLPSPHDNIVMDLLFLLCQWHGLAKLRLHHDLTLQLLDDTTTHLGSQFRNFQVNTCNKVKTVELQSEADRRTRRTAAKGSSEGGPLEVSTSGVPASSSRRPKKFSLSTPKYHSLGHYVENIRRFGTVDSFTSEIGETNHPAVKMWYKRTNRRGYSGQIATVERRRTRLRRLTAMLREDRHEIAPIAEEGEYPGVSVPVNSRYRIGTSGPFHLLTIKFISGPGADDPALHDFIPKLKKHLLPRVLHAAAPHLHPRSEGEQHGTGDIAASSTNWSSVELYNNRVYYHQTMRVKYTTYDIRRDEDIIRLETKPNIMIVDARRGVTDQPEDDPYRYGQVIGIFHADVMFLGDFCDGTRNFHSHRLEFLWVRWYRRVSPREPLRLQKLEFEPLRSSGAFGFLDPAEVVRGVHLIPHFASGRATTTRSAWTASERLEWNIYYLNRFVDRDMLMRYHLALAIGHRRVRALRDRLGITGDPQEASTKLPAVPIFKPLDPGEANHGDGESGEDTDFSSGEEGEGADQSEFESDEEDHTHRQDSGTPAVGLTHSEAARSHICTTAGSLSEASTEHAVDVALDSAAGNRGVDVSVSSERPEANFFNPFGHYAVNDSCFSGQIDVPLAVPPSPLEEPIPALASEAIITCEETWRLVSAATTTHTSAEDASLHRPQRQRKQANLGLPVVPSEYKGSSKRTKPGERWYYGLAVAKKAVPGGSEC